MARKTQYWEFIGGFVDGMVKKPTKGFTKSRAVAQKHKVKGTRLKRVFYAKGRKKVRSDSYSIYGVFP